MKVLFSLLAIQLILLLGATLYAEDIVLEKETRQSSLKFKISGDEWFRKGDKKKAAEDYAESIKLSKEYSQEELITMAIRMAWGGRLREAEELLHYVLEKSPENRKVNLQLARIISWQGRQIEAIRIVEKFIKIDTYDEEAILIKANALRFLGRADEALDLYDSLLSRKEEFDTRLGKAYAFANLSIPSKVKENTNLLKPLYPYQEDDLKELEKYKKSLFNPAIVTGFSYFNDSDDNEIHTYHIGFENYIKDLKVTLNYYYKIGSDRIRTSHTNDINIKLGKRLQNSLWGFFNLGVTQGEKSGTFLVGGGGLNKLIWRGQAGLSLNKQVLKDTRELMENKIRVYTLNLFLQQVLNDRLSLYTNYNHRWYSDNNSADFFQTSLQYKINFIKPILSIGYRVVYLNFKKQTRNGYFDPNDFLSNQIFLSIYHEIPKFYIFLEPFIGHQTFKRYGDRSSDKVYGGTGTVGIKLYDSLTLEGNLEGGNYAVGSATGWKYYQTSLFFKYSF